MTSQRPRVGITTYRDPAAWNTWNEQADLLPATYADAVVAAGGVPLLLPPAGATEPVPGGLVEAVLDGLHGLVLAGGADVAPERYGAARDPQTGPPRPDRDAWELALTHAALRRGLPLLGVCRGLQVLNVALGGDLVQHLPRAATHRARIGEYGRHEVRVAAGTRLGGLLGARMNVATYHHQGLGRIAQGLIAAAWTDDGTVEAVEHATAPWVVAVQWHPEVHNGAPLFDGLVAACAARSAAVVA